MRNLYAAKETYNSSKEKLTIENFNIFIEHKNDIIKSLILKLDDLQEEWKQDENPPVIFCSNCRKKHLPGKCPLVT